MTVAERMRDAAKHNRHYETLRVLCLEGATALEVARVAIEQLPAESITDVEIKRVALAKLGV